MLKSLRARLTTVFVCLAVVPLLLAGGIISVRSFLALNEQAIVHQETEAKRVSQAVNSFVSELENTLEMIFRGRDFTTLEPQNQKRILAEFLAFENRFQEISLIGKDGKELVREDRAQVVTEKLLRDRTADPDFQKTLATGLNYFGPVQFDPRSGEPLMAIAIPWIDPLTGKVEYVLCGLARLKKIWELLEDISHESELVFIIDGHGNIVGHPDPSVALSGRRFMLPDPPRGIVTGLDNERAVLAAERIGDHLMYAVAQKDESEALALARSVIGITFLVVLVALATAVTISILVIGSIVRPLQRLASVARAIQHGDLSQRAECSREDEVGELSLAFNEMTSRLRRTIEELGKEIAVREGQIAERKRAESALRENRTALKQILDTTPQSIFWKDRQSVYLGCNLVFARAVGLDDPDQIDGKTDFDLPWPREEAEAYRADDREVIERRQVKRHIIEPLQQADGRRLWIDTTKVPLLDADGEVIGVLGVYEDITERKRAEEERLMLETRLRQSQKMEAIGTLAGGIAHDFNNILSIIFGYTELAILEEEPAKRAQDLEQVRKGAERAKELVKQILTFSRRTEQATKKPLQVAMIVKEALKMLRASIPTTIEIRQEITSTGTVLADPTQIHQVVMNLSTNSYHAMRETGGILAVSLDEIEIRQEDEGYGVLVPGRYLKLAVSDTGCGMSHAVQEKIFEPYFTTKATGEGTGLGLAVVHGIVKGHNGHITVYSEPGEGTTFHVYLPLIETATIGLPVQEVVEDFVGKGERLLFVDDEELIREFADKLFPMHNYQVTCCTNGVQALEEFQNHPERFDLVVTDMTMPYLTGAELAQKILGIRPDMPIILCTGQSELINKEKAMAMGICGYLNKPVLKHDFLTAIRRALEKKKPQAHDFL